MSIASRFNSRVRAWARKRHGVDTDPLIIPARRVYILPTKLGMIFAGMVFLMFIGAMNYANNLALALTFVLGALGLVTMHHCQRNLAGVRVTAAANTPVFAGQAARFGVALDTTAAVARHDLVVDYAGSFAEPISAEATARHSAFVDVPTTARGRLTIDHVRISTRYPFGIFRAWTYAHLPMTCIVYPKPATRGLVPPPALTDIGGYADSTKGEEDFAGLRPFQAGDSPRRIAWKAYARGQALQVKQYAGTAVSSHIFDWDAVPTANVEVRLAQLCRWIEDAHGAGRAYGLRLPNIEIPVNVGPAHRQRCLTTLALFGLDDAARP